MRYLRLFEVFNRSEKCPLCDASTQANICRAFFWSGKCPSGICLVGEVSVGDVSSGGNVRLGCVWSRKCPSGMCLVGEMSVEEVSVGEESVGEMSVGDVSRNPWQYEWRSKAWHKNTRDVETRTECIFWYSLNKCERKLPETSNCWQYLDKTWKRKKRAYNNRIMNVEHETFNQLVFSLTRGEGPETSTFHKIFLKNIVRKMKRSIKKYSLLLNVNFLFWYWDLFWSVSGEVDQ